MTSLSHLVKFILVKLKNSETPAIGAVFSLIFHSLKKLRNAALKPQHFYECYIAKFASSYFFHLYLPLRTYAKRNRIKFILNVAPSVGHTTLELDNFFRKLHSKELDPETKYVFIVKNHYIFRDFFSLYKHRFHFAKASTLLYNLLLPFFLREKELTVDAGVSRLKWQIYPAATSTGMQIRGHPFHFQLFLLEGNAQVREAYERRMKSDRYFPLALPQSTCEPLLSKLGLRGKKLALVHLKTNVMNGTAAPTDPDTYLPTLEMLRDTGHQLIFVGREKMPISFSRFEMLNYSESRHASFRNDILLFQACSFAMVGGSGIAFLAQCYDKPFLYLNSWHAGLSPFTESSIFVPALVQKKDGAFLTFSEQNDLYFKLQSMDEQFPFDQYRARNANGLEILESAKELFSLLDRPIPRSELQEQYMTIDDGKGVLKFSKSRVSQYFLQEHKLLLPIRY